MHGKQGCVGNNGCCNFAGLDVTVVVPTDTHLCCTLFCRSEYTPGSVNEASVDIQALLNKSSGSASMLYRDDFALQALTLVTIAHIMHG